MALEHLSVTWDNFHKNISSGMNSLLEKEDFVDVTLAMEGRGYLKAHKMVLSVCSPYFCELFKTTPCKHPIVFMKDVSFNAMRDLLQFMYKGEVQVSEENFNEFIKTAESLEIRGLSGYGNKGSATESRQSKSRKEVDQVVLPSAKRLRLNEATVPLIHENIIVKNETSTAVQSLNVEEVSFKTELCEDEEEGSVALVDDDSNFANDPLQNTNVDENSDFGMIDDDDVNTSDGILKGDDGQVEKTANSKTDNDSIALEDATVDDDYWMMEGGEEVGRISDIEDAAICPILPERSKDTYEKALIRFEKWCASNDVKNINENALVAHFKEKSLSSKSSSLWAYYSMLRAMLSVRKNIDISKYTNLLAFLKRNSEGYKAKKTKAFKREDFEKFLREANNETYLLLKVVMIFGIAGACRRDELAYLLMENVTDEGNIIKVQLPNTKNKSSREFIITAGNIENVNLIEIIREYINLRPSEMDHQRFFVFYRQGKCTRQPVGVHSFGSMPKRIAQFLGLPDHELYTGHCFRKTSATFSCAPQLINFS